jgi:hypothetical protein
MFRSHKTRFAALFSAVALTLLAALCESVRAERPSTMKLFPEESVVYVRLANAKEFGEKFNETATGRMLRDPQLQPFIEQLYGDIGNLYSEDAEEKVGVSWEDLKNLPKGEVAFAIVARPAGKPAYLLLIDQGEEPSVAEKLLDRAFEFAGQNGADFTTEQLGDVELTIVRDADNQDRVFGVFERENSIVIATDPDVLRGVLWHWNGGSLPEATITKKSESDSGDEEAGADEPANEEAESTDEEEHESEFVPGRTLAENDRFATIIKQCRRPNDPPPQVIFFTDPIEIVRAYGRGNAGVQFAMGLLPALGADGLQAIGGALTYATDEYDDLSQFHVLLGNPRAGVLQLPAFETGDTTPQEFVPLYMETYMTMHWNMRACYDRVIALVDKYRYEGSVDKFMKEKVSEKMGIDLPTEMFDNLAGRYTWMVGYQKPAKMASRQHVLAAELKDEEAMKKTVETVREKFPDVFEERKFGNVTYYAFLPDRRMREQPPEEREIEPCVAIMDGYLFVGSSCQLFELCVQARDGTADRLIDSDDYARATEVLGREMAGATPAIFTVSRAEETWRHWYEMLTSEETRQLINDNKEDNKFLSALAGALEQHQLPPFEVLAPYLGPGGAILYDTDTGYHAIGFTLRNKTE